jgi:hypothetical protein
MTAVRDNSTATVRRPAVAGQFYPASASALAEAVRRYLAAAATELPALPGPVRAVIAPHAGYVCSGPVAGYSFAALAAAAQPDVETIVYLLGPAHYHPVNGVGLCHARAFQTPLGEVPVAVEVVEELVASGAPYRMVDAAHAPEHCLEVELPFLQVALPRLRVVPLLFDEGADPRRLAHDLAGRVIDDPHARIVVSSDLSHYLPYDEAARLDRAFLEAIVAGDLAGVEAGQACGLVGILCLMAVARQAGWTPHLLKVLSSGDTCGPRHSVVGYGAIAYTQPA